MNEPWRVFVVELCQASKSGQISLLHGGADGVEAFFQSMGFRSVPKNFSGHAAEDDVGGEEVDEDEPFLLPKLLVRETLVVSAL